MRGIRDCAFVAWVLFVFGTASWALEWPAPSAGVAVEFGSPLGRYPIPGILLSGEGIDVRAAEGGEVSFVRNAFDPRTALPSAMGATLVAEGRIGMAEIYAYIHSLTDPSAMHIVEGSLIARSTSAGMSPIPGFMFALYDRASSRWVNPRLFLPASADKKPPVIRRVSLEGRDKIFILGEQSAVTQGSYSLVMEIAELGGSGSDTILGPPYYLRVLVNGEKLGELKTEIARMKGGRLSFFPEINEGADLIDSSGRVRYPAKVFARGKTSIEILVRDFAGNERIAGWTVAVE